MAEVTAFRNNALPYPIYAQAWAVVFPMLDADGDLVTGATTPDAERSLNGDTFADCTNEAVEIATSSGSCYLILTGAEMTDVLTVWQQRLTDLQNDVRLKYGLIFHMFREAGRDRLTLLRCCEKI